MKKHSCGIRRLRKSARLSQRELARLVGLVSQGVFSQVEAGTKHPSLAVAFASALVFDVPVADLFPAQHASARRAVLAGALALREDALRPVNRAFLNALIARLGHPSL